MYHCELCERWFCEKHLKPRLAFIRDLNAESIPEIRVLYETEVKGKEGQGHPDFQYSVKRFRELDIEEKRRNELIRQALDRMDNYYKMQEPQPVNTKFVEPRDEMEPHRQPKTKRRFLTKAIIGILLILIIAGILFGPTIISDIQNPNAYTTLMVRDSMKYDEPSLTFGDTEYFFGYLAPTSVWTLTVQIFIGGLIPHASPHVGDTFRDFGIEIKVSNYTSDNISNYIVISVKPTVENYTEASLHYKEVNITLSQIQAVNITSSLANEIHQYWFTYTTSYGEMQGQLETQNSSRSLNYNVYTGEDLAASDFNIEIRVFKVEPQYMVIYVKPLY